jgi:hypothetical protein
VPTVDLSKIGFKGPLLFDGFFKTVLQQHFISADALFDRALKTTLWRQTNPATGQSDTRIYIDNKLKRSTKFSNFRPAILIQRLAWEKQRFGFNDNNGTGASVYTPKLGRWHGGHSFDCLTEDYSSVELLANEVMTFFTVYSEPLCDALCCDYLLATSVSPPVILEESSETYSVTVSIEYVFTNHWMLQPERPPLRHISLEITTQADIDTIIQTILDQ